MRKWSWKNRLSALLVSAVATVPAWAPAPVLAQQKIVDPFARMTVLQCADGFRKIGNACFKKCPEGQTAAAANVDRCVKAPPPPFVKRGFFGGCPTGYVDHPTDPQQCALPAAAHYILRRVR